MEIEEEMKALQTLGKCNDVGEPPTETAYHRPPPSLPRPARSLPPAAQPRAPTSLHNLPPPLHSLLPPSTMSLTTTEIFSLRTQAEAAKATSYSPYSKFRVGAAILLHTGEYVLGANVENASYPVGTCAERVAFGRGVVDGLVKAGGESVRAVGVAVDVSPAASPCGMCRQL